jgi:hypothetical protein
MAYRVWHRESFMDRLGASNKNTNLHAMVISYSVQIGNFISVVSVKKQLRPFEGLSFGLI